MRDVERLGALIKDLESFAMRDTVGRLQKDAAKNVYKELYPHDDLVGTGKEVAGRAETTGCSALTHAATRAPGNPQEMQTSRDAPTTATVPPEISRRDLLERMGEKFDSLGEKLDEAQGRANDVAHTVSGEVGALARLWRTTQETRMGVLQQIARATEDTASCGRSLTVCNQYRGALIEYRSTDGKVEKQKPKRPPQAESGEGVSKRTREDEHHGDNERSDGDDNLLPPARRKRQRRQTGRELLDSYGNA